MNRLFTFGCSFTQYKWPTWADILGKEFDYYENWGQSGGGNQYIFNSLIEAKNRNKFSKDDTIIIMWSNITREDRYINGEWKTPGNIFKQNLYPDSFLKNDERGYLIRDLATISAAADLLEYWGVKYHFLSMIPIDDLGEYTVNKLSKHQDVVDLYADAIKKIKPSVYEVIFNFDWDSRSAEFPCLSILEMDHPKDTLQKIYHGVAGPDWPTFEKFLKKDFSNTKQNIVVEIDQLFNKIEQVRRHDFHPLPSEHLEYIEKILPEYSIKDSTREWINDTTKLVHSNLKNTTNHLSIKIRL